MSEVYKDFHLSVKQAQIPPRALGYDPDKKGMNPTLFSNRWSCSYPFSHLGGWVFQPSPSILFFINSSWNTSYYEKYKRSENASPNVLTPLASTPPFYLITDGSIQCDLSSQHLFDLACMLPSFTRFLNMSNTQEGFYLDQDFNSNVSSDQGFAFKGLHKKELMEDFFHVLSRTFLFSSIGSFASPLTNGGVAS
jgi:hypothetical protein